MNGVETLSDSENTIIFDVDQEFELAGSAPLGAKCRESPVKDNKYDFSDDDMIAVPLLDRIKRKYNVNTAHLDSGKKVQSCKEVAANSGNDRSILTTLSNKYGSKFEDNYLKITQKPEKACLEFISLDSSSDEDNIKKPNNVLQNLQSKYGTHKYQPVAKPKNLDKNVKKLEEQRDKRLKNILKESEKMYKQKECFQFLEAFVDVNIMGASYGGHIVNSLKSLEIDVKIQPQYASTVMFKRKIPDAQLSENDLVETKFDLVPTDEGILIMSCIEFIRHVANATLLSVIKAVKSNLGRNKVILLIYQLQKYKDYITYTEKYQKRGASTTNKTYKNFDGVPIVNLQSIEEALNELQLFCNCSSRSLETDAELVLWITQITKSIAEIPYKQRKNERLKQMDFYLAGDNRDCVKVDKDGNGLSRLWKQILTMFPLARLETAEAIMAQYPTMTSLFQAYDRCGSRKEQEELLQDIQIRRAAGPFAKTRSVGIELSKKLCNFFNAMDGNSAC